LSADRTPEPPLSFRHHSVESGSDRAFGNIAYACRPDERRFASLQACGRLQATGARTRWVRAHAGARWGSDRRNWSLPWSAICRSSMTRSSISPWLTKYGAQSAL